MQQAYLLAKEAARQPDLESGYLLVLQPRRVPGALGTALTKGSTVKMVNLKGANLAYSKE